MTNRHCRRTTLNFLKGTFNYSIQCSRSPSKNDFKLNTVYPSKQLCLDFVDTLTQNGFYRRLRYLPLVETKRIFDWYILSLFVVPLSIIVRGIGSRSSLIVIVAVVDHSIAIS